MDAAAPGPAEPPPRHVAIIMDGNGRWAEARGLPRTEGHRRGADAVRKTVRACLERGIGFLTLYAFSSENWKRPAEEVHDLMGLLRLYLRRELDELAGAGVRLRAIGDRGALDRDIQASIARCEASTRANGALVLTVALNYGARNEIVAAARSIAADAGAGRIEPAAVDADVFASRLQTSGIPDPDLLIRTGGEHRLSNFLLWQCAYSELVFSPVMWPDFDADSLACAIGEFHGRERRYGGAGG